ncbi:MAG: hypothetical protein ACREM1_25745 [Longimicrobiales bacterium]
MRLVASGPQREFCQPVVHDTEPLSYVLRDTVQPAAERDLVRLDSVHAVDQRRNRRFHSFDSRAEVIDTEVHCGESLVDCHEPLDHLLVHGVEATINGLEATINGLEATIDGFEAGVQPRLELRERSAEDLRHLGEPRVQLVSELCIHAANPCASGHACSKLMASQPLAHGRMGHDPFCIARRGGSLTVTPTPASVSSRFRASLSLRSVAVT